MSRPAIARAACSTQCTPPPKQRLPYLEQCPLWVIRVTLTVHRSIPVFRNKRTMQEPVGMSQRCHQRTTALLFVISPALLSIERTIAAERRKRLCNEQSHFPFSPSF
jgi:hypothetical protein